MCWDSLYSPGVSLVILYGTLSTYVRIRTAGSPESLGLWTPPARQLITLCLQVIHPQLDRRLFNSNETSSAGSLCDV